MRFSAPDHSLPNLHFAETHNPPGEQQLDAASAQARVPGFALPLPIEPGNDPSVPGCHGEFEVVDEMLGDDNTTIVGSDRYCAYGHLPELAPYLGDPRLLAVAEAVFGKHVRKAQTEFKTQAPDREDLDWRAYHSDWPHDLTDRDWAGRVAQPFPDVTIQLSVLWVLSCFGPETGGTWVVPRSHRDPLNPRMHQTPEGLEERIDQFQSTGRDQLEAR